MIQYKRFCDVCGKEVENYLSIDVISTESGYKCQIDACTDCYKKTGLKSPPEREKKGRLW